VNGSFVPVGVRTVVEVTTGPPVVVVVEPCRCSVVLVVDPTTVDPATCEELVVLPSGIEVEVVDVEVVVSCGWVTGVVVLVVVDDVVVVALVVVVSCGSVVGVVVLVVVVEHPQCVVVVGGNVVDVVVHSQFDVVLVVGAVVEVVQWHVVLVVGAEVDEVGWTVRPQNCTLEMSGLLPWPTSGRPAFEK
jgi:hypothetical protein